MNKEKLNQAVIETLGFNPEEFRYKLDELSTEVQELKAILKQTIPTIGRSILDLHLLQEYLKQHNLDASEYIEAQIEKITRENSEEVKNLKLTRGRASADKAKPSTKGSH